MKCPREWAFAQRLSAKRSDGRGGKVRIFSSTAKVISVFVLLIALSVYLVTRHPQYYNQLAQVLFDMLLLGVSLWAGITFSREEAEKNATDRWLPAAEGACYELLTMSATVERMRLRQEKVCQSMKQFFPSDSSTDGAVPIQHVAKMRCEECAENLRTLQNHVENSIKSWHLFIEYNCAEWCQPIKERLGDRRKELAQNNQAGFFFEGESEDAA